MASYWRVMSYDAGRMYDNDCLELKLMSDTFFFLFGEILTYPTGCVQATLQYPAMADFVKTHESQVSNRATNSSN